MCYHGEDTKVKTKSGTSVSCFKFSCTRTQVRIPKSLQMSTQISKNPTLAASKPLLSYHHVFLQIIVSVSFLPKKILIFQEQQKKGNKPFSDNYIHYHKLRPRKPSRRSLTTTVFYLFFHTFLKNSRPWCYICHQWKQSTMVLNLPSMKATVKNFVVRGRTWVIEEAPVKWYNK
jgi:hypothetical protein